MFNSKSKTENVKRFEKVQEEAIGIGLIYYIIKDTVTGVHYLETHSGGLTPLLDENGNVVIEK